MGYKSFRDYNRRETRSRLLAAIGPTVTPMAPTEPKNLAALVLAVLVGSGGTAATLPKIVPSWYRPDPARGSELRELRADLERLRIEVREFAKEGPRAVRANQGRMMGQLDLILQQQHDGYHRQQ